MNNSFFGSVSGFSKSNKAAQTSMAWKLKTPLLLVGLLSLSLSSDALTSRAWAQDPETAPVFYREFDVVDDYVAPAVPPLLTATSTAYTKLRDVPSAALAPSYGVLSLSIETSGFLDLPPNYGNLVNTYIDNTTGNGHTYSNANASLAPKERINTSTYSSSSSILAASFLAKPTSGSYNLALRNFRIRLGGSSIPSKSPQNVRFTNIYPDATYTSVPGGAFTGYAEPRPGTTGIQQVYISLQKAGSSGSFSNGDLCWDGSGWSYRQVNFPATLNYVGGSSRRMNWSIGWGSLPTGRYKINVMATDILTGTVQCGRIVDRTFYINNPSASATIPSATGS